MLKLCLKLYLKKWSICVTSFSLISRTMELTIITLNCWGIAQVMTISSLKYITLIVNYNLCYMLHADIKGSHTAHESHCGKFKIWKIWVCISSRSVGGIRFPVNCWESYWCSSPQPLFPFWSDRRRHLYSLNSPNCWCLFSSLVLTCKKVIHLVVIEGN